MERLLYLEEARLHRLYLTCHALNLLVPLLDQLAHAVHAASAGLACAVGESVQHVDSSSVFTI